MTKAGAARYGLLDTIRGTAIVSMVIYHLCYDLDFFFAVPLPWLHSGVGYLWQQSICWCFIFLAGFCWSLDRQPLKRGGKIFLWGLVITIFTVIFMTEAPIIMGILSFLGCAIILMVPLSQVLARVNPAVGFVIAWLCFIILKVVNVGDLPLIENMVAPLDSWGVVADVVACLGFPGADFHSADYFPLIPWFFLFLAGYFFWRFLGGSDFFTNIAYYTIKPLAFVGRHALTIYLLHQPIIWGLLYLGFL